MFTLNNLLNDQKIYTIVTFDDDKYTINERQKQLIINSSAQFFELPDGKVLNKKSIKLIDVDVEKTREYFLELPEGKKMLKDENPTT